MSNATEVRKTRATEPTHTARAQEGIHPASGMEEDLWVEGRMEPDPRPGYMQRWVRIDIANVADNANVVKRMREGWLPRKASTVPNAVELGLQIGSKGGYQDVIIDRDRILCEMPKDRAAYRAEVVKLNTDRMNEAVNKDIHKHVPASHLALNTRKSNVSMGTARPRVPVVADDE